MNTPGRSQPRRKPAKRNVLLLSIASIVIIAGIITSLFFVAFPGTSHSIGSMVMGPQTTRSEGASLTATPNRLATPGLNSSQTPASNLAGTPGSTATARTLTSSSPAVTPTTARPTATPTATPTPTPETLTVDFTNPNGTSTQYSYKGSVTAIISGSGQASQTQWSDAFYRSTNTSGTPTTNPGHPDCWVLWINNEDPEYFGRIPGYTTTHTYTFQMTAPGGTLNFKVCDDVYSDNTGSYTITLTQN